MNKKVLGIVIALIIVIVSVTVIFNGKGGKSSVNSAEETILVKHRYGETEVTKNPKTIAVLDYGALDILNIMNVEVTALPKSSLPSYLEEFNDEKYVDIGALKEFNIEKINEIKPDLIIIEGRQEDSYEELSKIAPTIGLGTEGTDHFGSVNKNVKILGEIFGKEDFATEQLEKIETSVNKLNEKIIAEDKSTLVLMVSDGSMSAFGAKSRFGSIYNDFGFKEVSEIVSEGKHGDTISYEYILDKNPEYLFVIDKNVITGKKNELAKDVIENDLTKKTNAYKDDKIIYLNPEVWYIGGSGITATNMMIEEIEKFL